MESGTLLLVRLEQHCMIPSYVHKNITTGHTQTHTQTHTHSELWHCIFNYNGGMVKKKEKETFSQCYESKIKALEQAFILTRPPQSSFTLWVI